MKVARHFGFADLDLEFADRDPVEMDLVGHVLTGNEQQLVRDERMVDGLRSDEIR